MNWDAIGAIAELAGAVGVILSLLYLATQIKGQNRESRLAAYRHLGSSFNDLLRDMARDSDLVDLYMRGMADYDSLEPAAKVQFSSHANRIARNFESMYLQHLEDPLVTSAWEGMQNVVAEVAQAPGFRQWWHHRRLWFSNEFRTYMDAAFERSA